MCIFPVNCKFKSKILIVVLMSFREAFGAFHGLYGLFVGPIYLICLI